MEYEIELVKLRQKEVELGIKDRDSLVKASVAADDMDRKGRDEIRGELGAMFGVGDGRPTAI